MRSSLALLFALAAFRETNAFTFSTIAPPLRHGQAFPKVSKMPASLLAVPRRGKPKKTTVAIATQTDFEASKLASADARGKTAIIGGGPTGLTTAMMLAQKGWTDM